MRRLATLSYLACLCLVLFGATLSGQRYVGYFDNAYASPQDAPTAILGQGRFANATMSVRPCHPEDWEAARLAGVKVILHWPDEFWVGDVTAPALEWGTPIDWNRPMWSGCTRLDGSPERAVDWYYTVLQHRDQIAAFLLCDECDGNYGGVRFPFWTHASLEAQARKMEWNIASLRGIFGVHGWYPDVWINYTPAWVYGLNSNLPGYRLPFGVNWVSFDAYTPLNSCWGTISCAQLWAGMKARMRPDQRLVLIPRAFSGAYLNWNPSDLDVAIGLFGYLDYMLRDSQVIGMFPFIEWTLPGSQALGAGSVPVIGGSVRVIGQVLTGRQ